MESASNGEQRDQVAQVIDRLGRMVHSLQFAAGLNPVQWEALRYLRRANSRSRKPGALADFLGATKGTVSQSLKTLENKGLIDRSQDPSDHRAVRLDLTAAGISALNDDPINILAEAATEIPGELDSVAALLDQLLNAVERSCGRRSFGVCQKCNRLQLREGNGADMLFRCGLTGEVLAESDFDRLCANFEHASG